MTDIPTSFPSDSFMAALPRTDQLDLVRDGRPMMLPAGATLLFEGDLSDRVAIVLEGAIRVFATVATGREVLVTVAGPGEILGEMSALDGQPHSASVNTLASRSGRPDPRRDLPLPDGREPEDRGRRGAPSHARAAGTSWGNGSVSRRSTCLPDSRGAWWTSPTAWIPGAARSSSRSRNGSSPSRAERRAKP